MISMNSRRVRLTALAAFVAGGVSLPALAQTPPVPQVSTVGPADLFQDIVNGAPSPINQYASAAAVANLVNGTGGGVDNLLIGGDPTTNLFQRATTGSSVTTTLTYGGPDRWAYWSGTNTAMTVSQSSTAGDLFTGNKYAFKMARTSGQTGVVQMCMAQEVETLFAQSLAGSTVELGFQAF